MKVHHLNVIGVHESARNTYWERRNIMFGSAGLGKIAWIKEINRLLKEDAYYLAGEVDFQPMDHHELTLAHVFAASNSISKYWGDLACSTPAPVPYCDEPTAQHRSTSVGDVIEDADGKKWAVDNIGFLEV